MTQRFTQEEAEELSKKFIASGLSMNKFADLHKIPRSTFNRYFKKFKEKKTEVISADPAVHKFLQDLSLQINALKNYEEDQKDHLDYFSSNINRLNKEVETVKSFHEHFDERISNFNKFYKELQKTQSLNCRLEENLKSLTESQINLIKQEASFEKRKFHFEVSLFFIAFLILAVGYYITAINISDKEVRYISPPNTFIENNN